MNDRARLATGVACGVGAGALWGGVFLAPLLVPGFTPLQLATARYLGYGALAAVPLAARWRRVARLLGPREWRALVGLSLLCNTLYYVALGSAVRWGGAPMVSLVIGVLPVAVTLIGSRDADAAPLKRLWPSLILSLGGLALIGGHALLSGGSGVAPLAGFACALAALASWTGFAVWNSRCLRRRPDLSPSDWNMATGAMTGAQALLLLPAAIGLGPVRHTAPEWLRFGGVVMALALLASLLGNMLWNRASRLLPLSLLGQMILLETLFALLYAFLWEQRLPLPVEAVAILLVVASALSSVAAHR